MNTLQRVRRRVALVAVAALCVPAAAAPAALQDPAPAEEAAGFYEVQPGENFHTIAAKLLGNADEWPRLWQLNPEIGDPDRLRPGQRLRIPGGAATREPAPPPTEAELRRLSPRVEEQPHPQTYWAPASVGDMLQERDGLRTHAKASAEMVFDDGTRYLVSEHSLLFLRAPERARARSGRALEVIAGQADVEVQPAAPGTREIEIVIGASQSRARPSAGAAGQARARRAAAGTAQLMVYRGSAEVLAAGVRVDVPHGMGTSVPEGRPPAPPEKLLPAPRTLGPPQGVAFDYANPLFSWEPVPGAASYTLEVCRDAACAELIDRVTGVQATRWASDGLPLGELHWRVSAVSASGLDGYASAPAPFEVRSLWRRPLEPAGGL